ncbi:MAG: signal peptidase II [Acidimicrobiales bacterium]
MSMSRAADLKLASIAGAVVIADQATKFWAQAALADGPVDVVWTLRFFLTSNTGMSFSAGEGAGVILGVLIIGILGGLIWYRKRIDPGWPLVAYSAIVGGAIGNLLDRLFRGEGWLRGAVVDFIDFQWWPIFNVADMGIVIGGIWLVVLSWLNERNTLPDAAAAADADDEAPA